MSNIRQQVGDLTEFTPGNDLARARLDTETKQWQKRCSALKAENEQQNTLLLRAVEVIEWKSLYQKAEMGWYAEALVAEILHRTLSDTAERGKQWYERIKNPSDSGDST